MTQTRLEICDLQGQPHTREFVDFSHEAQTAGKDGFNHYMLKEIHEQPEVFGRCWRQYVDQRRGEVLMPTLEKPLSSFTRLTVVACGTSYFAGLVAKYWLEQVAGIPVDLDIASEFRYRQSPIQANSAALFISQSGETADTLAAMKYSKEMGQTCLAMVNVINSSMAHEADVVFPTYAGPEIGVASTKAFMSQLTTLLMITLAFAKANQRLDAEREAQLFADLKAFSQVLESTLQRADELKAIATELVDASNALFLGRGFSCALAEEGALKLKEISYIHAEAYPAGELKHGPLALVDEQMPVVMIAPPDALFGKTLSNLREVASRGGKIILLSNAKGVQESEEFIKAGFILPEVNPLLQPMLYAVPLQLIAYYCAVMRGNDVDQPRNLAKSVTVE